MINTKILSKISLIIHCFNFFLNIYISHFSIYLNSDLWDYRGQRFCSQATISTILICMIQILNNGCYIWAHFTLQFFLCIILERSALTFFHQIKCFELLFPIFLYLVLKHKLISPIICVQYCIVKLEKWNGIQILIKANIWAKCYIAY